MLYNYACKELKQLEKRISHLESQLRQFPEGKIYCVRDGKYFKWYHHTSEKDYYLGKKKRHLAELLARKMYFTLLREDLIHEKRAIEFYLRHHQLRPWKSERLMTEKPQYQKLLQPFFNSDSRKFQEWANASYTQNPLCQEQLIHSTPTGIHVRSKSEALIAMVLYNNRIPHRYECALQLGETVFYPDFTIIHPKTGQIYYLEHFGMIDNPVYSQKAFQKLQVYSDHGIYPTINLITTYETKDHPLTLDTIDRIVKDYFQ